MSSQYYSLYDCFEMLADTTIPQLLAEFPRADRAANANAPIEFVLAAPLYTVHPDTIAAADRLAAAAAASEAPAYFYFAPGEAAVDAAPGVHAQPGPQQQSAQLELFAVTALDVPAPTLRPALSK